MNKQFIIALSKGRIFKETLPLLAHAGIEPVDDPETSRKLILDTNRDDTKLLILRASDVPTYVQYGAADVGVAGKDVLLEHGGEGLYEPVDLQIAKCKLMVAGRVADTDSEDDSESGRRLRVAVQPLRQQGLHVKVRCAGVALVRPRARGKGKHRPAGQSPGHGLLGACCELADPSARHEEGDGKARHAGHHRPLSDDGGGDERSQGRHLPAAGGNPVRDLRLGDRVQPLHPVARQGD